MLSKVFITFPERNSQGHPSSIEEHLVVVELVNKYDVSLLVETLFCSECFVLAFSSDCLLHTKCYLKKQFTNSPNIL